VIDHHESWICCQLGAREHYAIPRALAATGRLELLITDIWLDQDHPCNLLPPSYLSSLRARYHPEVPSEQVKAFNQAQIAWEIFHRHYKIRDKVKEWELITARNLWWQKQVVKILKKHQVRGQNITLFAYSYAALELFVYAKSRGWKTVLGQIDPGIIEAQLVQQEAAKYPQLSPTIINTPDHQYWSNWQQECQIADLIIVNSNWSQNALQKVGIDQHKITTIPLAYQATRQAKEFTRTYPENFSVQRPLKVLFLGQVIIRKGINAILEAVTLIQDYPLEFWFVGQVKVTLPKTFITHPQIKWFGAVSRSQTDFHYQQADVFLFPTHSDGFGLTQLEAQAWKLPIIASQFCGAVVKEQNNGLILPQITGKAIAETLIFCLQNPQKLAKFSSNSTQVLSGFTLSKLAQKITTIS
jgi:glycosyltransferase involved in cell wall biosynthesis